MLFKILLITKIKYGHGVFHKPRQLYKTFNKILISLPFKNSRNFSLYLVIDIN
jgi:hypothetical protein